MPKFDVAKSVQPFIDDVLWRCHDDLHKFGVRVKALFAYVEDSSDPAVKLHGYPCAAIIEITKSAKSRLLGMPDAVITIDRAWWNGASEPQREALIDHELTHLELKRDKEGEVVIDDCNRAALTMKLHDWQMGGFLTIANRHGINALEVQMYQDVAKDFGGMLLSFGVDEEDDDVREGVKVLAGGREIHIGGGEFNQ